jgi:hypothetical protein
MNCHFRKIIFLLFIHKLADWSINAGCLTKNIIFLLLYYVFLLLCMLCVLLVCNCVLYYRQRMSTQLQLTNMSYSIHLFETLKGKVVQIFVSRKIRQVLVWYHRTHKLEETDWLRYSYYVNIGR